ISIEILEKSIKNINLREKRNAEDETINLKYFSQQILTTIQTSEVCWVPCASFSSDNPKNLKYYKSNKCNGWIDECRYFTGPRDMGDARFCLSTDGRRMLLGVTTSFHQRYGMNPNDCQGGKSYVPKDGHCFCLCTCTANGRDKSEHNWYFSSREQKSDIANNKVVTGVRFVELKNVIYLQINEGVPGSKDARDWRPISNVSINYQYDDDDQDDNNDDDEDLIFLTYYRRTINLDEIFLPSDYLITGVRFAKADDVTLRLEVQGTKFDVNKNQFVLNSQKWFNSESNSNNETFNNTLWGPDLYGYETTNLSVKFRAGNLEEDFGKITYPLLYSPDIKTNKIHGLNSIRLCRIYFQGYETIIPQIALSKMLIRNLNNKN
ncbi:hypothetical protein PV325_008290, partial [Microctonus aethiopoides]